MSEVAASSGAEPLVRKRGRVTWAHVRLRVAALRRPRAEAAARNVEEITADLIPLVNGMYETMALAEGVGLAAPQVGVRKRLFTYDLHDGEGPGVVINPEIVERSGEVEWEEGCLSVPGFKFEIVRSEQVTIRGIDLDGKEIVLEGDDLLARMIQHEIDHLDGVLLLDRLEPDVRKAALRELRTRQLAAGAIGNEPGL